MKFKFVFVVAFDHTAKAEPLARRAKCKGLEKDNRKKKYAINL